MKQKYYSLKNILSKRAVYNIVIGQRGNGKTYAVLKYGVERYIEGYREGKTEQLAIIRRYAEHFKGKRASTLFDNLVANGEIEKLSGGLFTGVQYRSNAWYLTYRDEDNNVVPDSVPFAYAFALTQVESDKSSSYPNVTTVLFDEFLSRSGYLVDEFNLFQNTLSTIIRNKDNVRVFMCGNTVDKYGCPYFTEMKLTHVKEQKLGTIDVYKTARQLPESFRALVAVEYCEVASATKSSEFYFDWDSNSVKMITKGYWEMSEYPRLPYRYKDIASSLLLRFFIVYRDEKLNCEIYNYDESFFIYVQRKTTPLNISSSDIVFTLDVSPQINYFTRLLHPSRNVKVLVTIARLFLDNKVFYQNDEVGEIARSYIIESEQKIV